ncbi:MAG: FKBP-type peptidyl-prolyl cis-trans isomerase [Bacteroidales bacterium]|nr:FKBP-type peptidyl-prolyl cis-trans isomerase [Bacteroidales bacterium]
MKYLLVIHLLPIALIFSCSNDFKKTKSGIEYKIITENKENKRVLPGNIITLSMYYTTINDSILYDTRELTTPFRIKISKNIVAGTIDEALCLLHEGDSAIFKLNAIKFFTETKKEDVPSFIKTDDEKLTFYVKVLKVMTLDEFIEEKKQIYNQNEREEMQMLEHYLKICNITVKPTPSGLYYIEKKKGTGKKPSDTSKVAIHYFLSILNGEIIDNTYQRGIPFEFQLGKELVIPGLEEGVKYMCEGGEATLIIPSKLAYGDKQYKLIPPFSTLIFEVKLLKVD